MIALAAPLETISAPALAYGALLPVLIVIVAACASVLVEAGVSREARYPAQMVLTIGALLAALIAVIVNRDERVVTAAGAISVDGVRTTARPGDAIVVPPATRFELSNAGDTVLSMLCCLPVGGQAIIDGNEFTPPWAQ